MKKKNIIIALLIVILFAFGCNKAKEGGLTYDDWDFSSISRMEDVSGLAYNEQTTRWEGTGYNPEAPAFGVYGMAMRSETAAPRADNSSSSAAPRAGNSGPSDSMSAELTNSERKLVKSANVRVKVENLEAADAFITELMGKYDAYSATTGINDSAHYYSLRVPSHVYDIFLSEMSGMGRLIHRTENVEDVTLSYYDLEGRLETKRELLGTFQSYLRRASNIEEILKVEARISELQYDIDATGRQLRYLANRVDYATIELSVLGPATAVSKRGEIFGERIGQMFGGFGGFLSSVAFVIIGIIIYGIPILLLLALFFWLLFGKIGLVKKLWIIIKGKKQGN